MKYIQCPEVYTPAWYDFSVFMGGGITGCGDWQEEMRREFADDKDIILVNPRRQDFDITNSGMSYEQRQWEHDHIKRCYLKMFWYPNATLCPITLYETGVSAARGDQMVVGIEPGYARTDDVIHQLEMIRPDVKVVFSLPEIYKLIREKNSGINKEVR